MLMEIILCASLTSFWQANSSTKVGLHPPLMCKVHVCTARGYCPLTVAFFGLNMLLICEVSHAPSLVWHQYCVLSFLDLLFHEEFLFLTPPLPTACVYYLQCCGFYHFGWADWTVHISTHCECLIQTLSPHVVCWYTSVQSLSSLHMSCNYCTTAIKVTCEIFGDSKPC